MSAPIRSIACSLIGDRVILHPGCRLGQDGFGYVMSPRGHTKVPQIGRVIVQDDVEIGAGTAIDRGAIRDTVIGEGTKIDNLVQIGHNVSVGRHCIIVAHCAIAGSVTLGDFVALGGRATINNHVTIGEGAQVAGMSGVNTDIPPGGRYAGLPAKPAKIWMREVAWLDRARQELQRREKQGRGRKLNPMNETSDQTGDRGYRKNSAVASAPLPVSDGRSRHLDARATNSPSASRT